MICRRRSEKKTSGTRGLPSFFKKNSVECFCTLAICSTDAAAVDMAECVSFRKRIDDVSTLA